MVLTGVILVLVFFHAERNTPDGSRKEESVNEMNTKTKVLISGGAVALFSIGAMMGSTGETPAGPTFTTPVPTQTATVTPPAATPAVPTAPQTPAPAPTWNLPTQPSVTEYVTMAPQPRETVTTYITVTPNAVPSNSATASPSASPSDTAKPSISATPTPSDSGPQIPTDDPVIPQP